MAMIMAGTKLQIRPSQRSGGVVGRGGFLVLDQLSRHLPKYFVLLNPDVYLARDRVPTMTPIFQNP